MVRSRLLSGGLAALAESGRVGAGRQRRDPEQLCAPRNSKSACQLMQNTQAAVLISGYGGSPCPKTHVRRQTCINTCISTCICSFIKG